MSIHFTTDGGTMWLQCFHDDPDAEHGAIIDPVDAGDAWETFAAKVREHQAEHGCGPAPEPANGLAYGEVFHAEYAAAQRRFMRESREWGDLAATEQASIRAGARAVAERVTSTMAQPIAEPAPGAKAPERPAAKFRAWMKSQGYPAPDEDGSRYSGEEMEAAYEAGVTDAVVAYAASRPEPPQPPDDEYRLTPAGQARADAEAPERYALIEQMGHRATVGTIRETTFAGKQMLAVTDLKTGGEHLISPDSLYEVTWLTEEQARSRARPWTATALPAGIGPRDDDDPDPWQGDDDEAEEG